MTDTGQYQSFGTYTIKRHSTLESLMDVITDGGELELLPESMDADGKIEPYPMEDYLDAIRHMGKFGFAEYEQRCIHLWYEDAKVTDVELLQVIGHELGHCMEEHALPQARANAETNTSDGTYIYKSTEDEALASEFVAETYAFVAAEAARLLYQLRMETTKEKATP